MHIKKLPLSEAQKIAAGEVIERPCNIVKELVENALDAQASHITITIKNGGHDFIRVTDNGHGMDPDDAVLSFEHHATSKISAFDDLATVLTHGFRGEALTSIAAISNVVMVTKTIDALEGTKLVVHDGTIDTVISCAHVTGTDITVTGIFDSVPVRKKFLKSRETEARHIASFIRACALIYPEKEFTFISDERTVLHCRTAKSLHERGVSIFGTPFAAHSVAINAENKYGVIVGVASNHHTYRYDRSDMFFFVNNRWIKNHHISAAVLRGYGAVLPPGRYPVCVLSISVKTTDVDINTHPRKEEVRFLHARAIEDLIKLSLVQSLENNITTALQKTALQKTALQRTENKVRMPGLFLQQTPVSQQPAMQMLAQEGLQSVPFKPFEFEKFFLNEPLNGEQKLTQETVPVLRQEALTPDVHDSTLGTGADVSEAYSIIGQLHATYILLEHDDGLYVIDQHAAHERVLYEQIAARFKNVDSVVLLFPELISVTAACYDVLVQYDHVLADHGIVCEPFGSGQFKVSAVPPYLKTVSWQDFLIDCAQNIIHEKETTSNLDIAHRITHALRAQMACKAAVKAGDSMSNAEMEKLVRDLQLVNNRFSCPHGRPTTFLYTMHELEKKFRRVGN